MAMLAVGQRRMLTPSQASHHEPFRDGHSQHNALFLQVSQDVNSSEWTTISSQIPISSPLMIIDKTATVDVARRFYRAFLTP